MGEFMMVRVRVSRIIRVRVGRRMVRIEPRSGASPIAVGLSTVARHVHRLQAGGVPNKVWDLR